MNDCQTNAIMHILYRKTCKKRAKNKGDTFYD